MDAFYSLPTVPSGKIGIFINIRIDFAASLGKRPRRKLLIFN
jgi:hypothetical protein